MASPHRRRRLPRNSRAGKPARWVARRVARPLAPLAARSWAARIHKMSAAAAQTTFWFYSAHVGLSLAPIFVIRTGGSVARTFLITAGAFAGLTAYDTQQIKLMYYEADGEEVATKKSNMGALKLPRLPEHVHLPDAHPRRRPQVEARRRVHTSLDGMALHSRRRSGTQVQDRAPEERPETSPSAS